jgi:hypothetical protein
MDKRMPGRIARRIPIARLTAALIGSLALTACGSGSTDADAPVPPVCQTNNTADVAFRNNSGSNMTYQVKWDGQVIGVVNPGQTRLNRSVSAGTTHSLTFRNAGNTADACAPSFPSLARCTSTVFSCSA